MGTQNQTTTQLRGTQILDKSITQNDITLSGITKTNIISEDNIVISNANELYKVSLPEFIESIKAGFNISLSGTLSVSATGYVKWSDRYIISSSGNGSHFSTNGYFYIETPLSGTITGVGGASNVTATSDGIPLSDWQSLYYILPIGSDSTSLAANFRITSTSSALVVPHNWILLCTVNGLNHVYFFSNGVKLNKSQSIDLSLNDSVNADKLDGFHLSEITGNSTTFYDNRYVNSSGDTINGNLTINGNIYQYGTAYETHANKIFTTGDTITLRDGAVNGLLTGEYVGLIAKKYDGTNDGHLVYNKDGWLMVGDSGDLQKVATIDNSITNGYLVKYNTTTNRLEGVNPDTYTTPTYITTNYTPKLAGYVTNVSDVKNFDMTNGGLTANYGFFDCAYNADNKPNPDATWIQGIKFPMANNPDYSQLIVSDGNNVYYGSEGNNVWQDWKTFVMQYDNVNFSKITVNNVGKIYFDGYGGELALATHSYGAYLDVNNSSNALYIRNANNSYSNIATFSDSVNTIGNTTLFGNGSNTKVSISDGGYIGVDSINTNDNLILRAKGAAGLLLNYGSTGSHVGFYDGTTPIGYINATETYFGNNLTIIGNANIGGSLTTSKLYDTSRKKQYVFENYTGGWVRIAKLSVPSTGEAVGTISIANSFGYSHSVSTTFSFGVSYRDVMPWVTQLGATNVTLPKVRIVSPTNANTDYYIEVYYIAVGGPNLFYIQLSNEHNVELLNSFTNGEVPAGYVGREFNMNLYGISTHSVQVGNNWANGNNSNNRIEVNDAGYLSLTTHENELTIGKTSVVDGNLFINYRQPKTGSAPTTYIWNKGNSTEYADHRVGSLIANAIRFNSDYTTNYISGDGYGMTFNGSQYVHFTQSSPTYFSSQIIARGGITNDSGNYVALNKQTYVDGHIEFKNKLQSLDTGILAGNTAFQIRGVGESGVYASGIAFDTFNIESGESAYSYKERMRIFSNGNIAIGTTSDSGYKFKTSTNKNNGIYSEVSTPTISSNSTTYAIGMDSNITQSYNIDNGVIDYGYRMGLNIAAYSNTPGFLGEIGEQIGMRIQYGAYTSSGTGAINKAIGISLNFLDGYSSTSIVDAYSIHSSNTAKFYHQGNVLLGTTTDNGYKLNVYGDAIIGSTNRLKLMQFPGQGYWIDIPVGVGKASGIGHGGAGVYPWIAFAGQAGNWFSNSFSGDTCYRNTSGRLLFGNSAGVSAMTIVSDRVGIGKVPVSPYKFEVSGATNITGTLNVSSTITVSSTTKVNNLNVDRVDNYHIWVGSQAAYDAISTKDANTIYYIT